MKASEIRKQFIEYFRGYGHAPLASASLIPSNDPTLLFVNAGMVPFKDQFTGKSNPSNMSVTSIQKCVRAGGKHNDLENVGMTSRHHTFFEMLGNFSFGSYFKEEAIEMAWNFLTKTLSIDASRLFVTAHHSDPEAAQIWHEKIGLPKDRIFFRGDKDNFWEMGEVGPCGPCSEIFYDHGPEHSDKNADTSECILDDEDRYVEIWNLVFMQYEKKREGEKIVKGPLPRPCVDTGAGLERIAAVLQGEYNNFDTDVFSSLVSKLEEISGENYFKTPHLFRVVIDHARSCTMLLSDGVIPSNEGRGYVLRRIIRRAVRHLDLLGVKECRFFEFAEVVIESFDGQYDEARENLSFIQKYLRLEEEGFRKTLSSGLKLLEKKINLLKNSNETILNGEDAFTLYDTHGFPPDLTEIILKEKGLEVDLKGLEAEMKIQKERSKKAGQFSAQEDNKEDFYALLEKYGPTKFIGYNHLEGRSELIGLFPGNKHSMLVFHETPFYSEGGGQQGDRGTISDGDTELGKVIDTKSLVSGLSVHIVECDASVFGLGKQYKLEVDQECRAATMANHTATHLLQAALRETLGDHVKQSGSSVGPKRLRFDFTHPEGVTKSELKEIEALVNRAVYRNVIVDPQEMTKDQAMEKGALALFGEKYGDAVRVIDIPGESVELCGGTHVKRTGEISLFKIVSESSLASGVRRIEAVTRREAFSYLEGKLEILSSLKSVLGPIGDEEVVAKVSALKKDFNSVSKELHSFQEGLKAQKAQEAFEGTTKIGEDVDFKFIEAPQESDLRQMGDLFIDKFPKGLVFIALKKGDSVAMLLKTFKGNKDHDCSKILKGVLAKHQGRGGGRPFMAQGSIDSSSFESAKSEILSMLGG